MNVNTLRRIYTIAKLVKNKEKFSKTEMAKRYNVSRQAIHNDIEWIERNKAAIPLWEKI